MINDFYNRFDNMFEMLEKTFRDIIDTCDTKPATSTKPKAYKSISGAEKAINREKPFKENIKLSPPWTTIYNKLRVFFAKDPDIKVNPVKLTKAGDRYIVIESPYCEKIDALVRLMKDEYKFGNVTLKIHFAVSNGFKATETDGLYGYAIDGLASNAAIVDIKKVENFVHDEFVVIEFAKEIVQFYNDDLGDYYGNWNGTYVDVAKELFKENPRLMFTITEE